MQAFEEHGVSFVSVTQQFNTSHSMGRLTLNILLSFAQFEREIIGERIRDKNAAQRRKGKWTGGVPVLRDCVFRAPSSRRGGCSGWWTYFWYSRCSSRVRATRWSPRSSAARSASCYSWSSSWWVLPNL